MPKDLAVLVARHLVMAGRLLDDDPETAYRHARFARRFAARIGVVREACGLVAYHVGQWSDALNELRAARRISGQEAYLPVVADCERGLGRPERALELAKSDEAGRLDAAGRVEMCIVEAGARRDLGQPGAGIIALQIPELREQRMRPWSARLFYAYADALTEADRQDEARDWFARAAAADREGETDAAERYAELEGLGIVDVSADETVWDTDPEDQVAKPGTRDAASAVADQAGGRSVAGGGADDSGRTETAHAVGGGGADVDTGDQENPAEDTVREEGAGDENPDSPVSGHRDDPSGTIA